MMGRKLKKILASCLAVSMCISMSMLSVSVSAAEGSTVKVETSGGNYETVNVVITIDKVENDDGSVTENKTFEAENFVTNDGIVNYEGTSSMTTNKDNVTTGESQSQYTVVDGDYHAVGGSETAIEQGGITDPDGIEVDVPLTKGSQSTSIGDASQETVVTGDPKKYPEDGVYDYTETTVTGQASVTVTTTDVAITESQTGSTDLTHVSADAKPDANNDLTTEVLSAADEYVAGSTEIDGYEYMYLGSGNTSQFRPAIMFTEAMTAEDKVEKFGDGAYINNELPASHLKYFLGQLNEEYRNTIAKNEDGSYKCDDQGYLLDVNGDRIMKEERTVVGPDGKTYYLQRFDNMGGTLDVEGWYQDGEWKAELNGDNKYRVVYATAQQFVLVDKETGETITTYCADISTQTEAAFGYTVENLEDATYYTDEQAAMIRSIAASGYWGVTGTDTDDQGNPVPKSGSLEAMKEMLRNAVDKDGNPIFSETEVASLTDGVALTATQMAIWSCSNKMSGVEFVNSHYVDKDENFETAGAGAGVLTDIPTDKEDETKLMFKVYEYLTNLAPTYIAEEDKETNNTVINADNFLKDISLTVIEKAEGHENNVNDNDDNDAYVTNLTFALMVTPSEKNGDDLVVKVVDAQGNILASGRIAGENKEDESYEKLTADQNGNYSFENIIMVEGKQNFNITLEGIQNLQEGVYLYSSEIQVDGDNEISSQTMVGIASGKHEVGVSMNIELELSVEDEIVVTKRIWREEWVDNDDGGETPPSGGETPPSGGETPPEENIEIPEEDVPLANVEQEETVELLEEEIPMADVPKTGDSSAMWMLMSALSGSGLLGLAVLEKNRKKD